MPDPSPVTTRAEIEAGLRRYGLGDQIQPESITDRVIRKADREQLRREAEEDARHGVRPIGRTLSERVLSSSAYRAAAAEHRSADIAFSVPVMTARELAGLLRLRTNVDETTTGPGLVHEDAAERWITTQPRPARVLDFIRPVPLDSPIVHRANTGTYTGNAGGVPEGALMPELSNLNLTDEELLLKPYPVSGTVSRSNLADRGYFGDVVERIFRIELRKSLERDILTGAGTSDATHAVPLGLTNLGLTSVTYTTGARADAIAQAVEDVQDADFYAEPLAVVANPATLRKIRTDKGSTGGSYLRLSDAVPDVSAWIPSTAMPAGNAIVGAFGTAVLFVHGDTDLQVSTSHNSDFLTGQAALRVAPVIAVRFPQPAAFVSVTGL